MVKTMLVAVACCAAGGATAQSLPVAAEPNAPASIVPANTGIPVVLDQEVSSKDARVGQQFGVTVSRDIVTAAGAIIPRGTHGVGEVTYRTGKGAYGKSGKMEIQLRSLDIGGRLVPMTGKYREEGAGKTGVTVATIAIGGLLAGAFVNGQNAVFEQGRELQGFTSEAIAVAPTVRFAPPMQMASVVSPHAVAQVRDWVPVPRSMPAAVAVVRPNNANYTEDTAGASSVDIFQRRLAAAQPVRRANPQQGWTITD